MKGIIKRITSTFFAALFVLMGCSGLVLGGLISVQNADVVASAETDEYKDYPRYDGLFEFGESTNVSFAGYPNKNPTIEFNLVITNPDKFKIGASEYAKFDFDVVRTANGKDVPIYTLRILSIGNNQLLIGHKFLEVASETMDDLSILPGSIELVPDQVTGGSVQETKKTDVSSTFWSARENELNEGTETFILDKIITNKSEKPFLTHTNGNDAGKYKGYQMLDLKLKVDSNYTDYFVSMTGGFNRRKEGTKEEWVSPFKKEWVTYKYFEWEMNSVKSPTWSVSSALQQMEYEGRLTAENLGVDSTTFETVAGISGTPEKRTITVEYLEQIGKSPFAAKKKVKVAVPMTDGKPVYDDICSAMGNKSLKCLGATVSGFEPDTFNVYRAKYESSFYLQVKQEDGHYDEAYLKLEKSLAEFVDGLAERDIFEEGTFSYALNNIRTLYPECENYESDEIYGLWGYIVIPETTSFSSLLIDLLKVDPENPAIIKHFAEKGTLKYTPYNNLLKSEYDYGWFSAFSSWILTWFKNELTTPVQHVFFYADLKETEGGFDKSAGADNPLEILGKGLEGFLGKIGDLFERDKEQEETARLRSILVLSGVVTVAGAAVAIAYLWYKKK